MTFDRKRDHELVIYDLQEGKYTALEKPGLPASLYWAYIVCPQEKDFLTVEISSSSEYLQFHQTFHPLLQLYELGDRAWCEKDI